GNGKRQGGNRETGASVWRAQGFRALVLGIPSLPFPVSRSGVSRFPFPAGQNHHSSSAAVARYSFTKVSTICPLDRRITRSPIAPIAALWVMMIIVVFS